MALATTTGGAVHAAPELVHHRRRRRRPDRPRLRLRPEAGDDTDHDARDGHDGDQAVARPPARLHGWEGAAGRPVTAAREDNRMPTPGRAALYASIRRYRHVRLPERVAHRVRKGLVPILEALPGLR